MSRTFGKTLREAPADAEMISHQLLIRANFVRPVGAGIYVFMPFGYRVLRKLWSIMAQEMDAIGGQEMWMPNIHPSPLWQATGRWDTVDVLMKVKAAGGREYALSATHEEIVVDLALREIDSYRDLPKMVYHISKKFRDEPRARGGLLRLREFVMKDAYSLDTSEDALDDYYPSMVQAYFNIFDKCGVPTIAINADVGMMGGKTSQEFVVPHPQGEDLFIACSECDYAANVEAAEFVREGERPADLDDLVKVATPDCTTIPEADGRFVFGIVRGDLEVNDVKLNNALGGGTLRAATDDEIRATGATPGYASPIGLKIASELIQTGVYVIVDHSVEAGGNFVVGANDEGYHYTGANYPRDFAISRMADIAQAGAGHKCPQCGGRIEAKRAIEAGHCFKLGTRFSEATDATYLDDNGQKQLIYMGSYGIGLDRLMAIIVELHHDKDGIIWPETVAPFEVHLIHIGKGEEVKDTADAVYDALTKAGFSVLYDDRNASPGVKFKDADLIGVPWRLTVGARSLAKGGIEVKRRSEEERTLVATADLVDHLSSS
jgi:prolyl-tRNA synthetase